MIRQVFKIKYPIRNYVNCGIIYGHRLPFLVSTNFINQKRFYSAGGSSPSSKLKKIIYTAGVFAVGTGGLVLYAKYDPDLEKTLNDNVPGYKSFVKSLTKEDVFQVYVADPVINLKDTLLGSATELIGLKESDTTPTKPRENVAEVVKKDAQPIPAAKKTDSPLSKPLESVLELEKVLNIAVQEYVQAYNSLTRVIKDYNEGVERLIDHSFQEINSRTWSEIARKQEEKQRLFHAAEAKLDAAMKLIEKMKVSLQDLTVSEVKERMVKNLNRTTDNVGELKRRLENDMTNLNITDKFYRDVQAARKYFFEQLDALIPNKGLHDSKLRLTDEELNLFLTYAYQKILYYQGELSKLEGIKESEINDALNKLKERDAIIDATIQAELDKERRRLQEEFGKKELAVVLDAKRRTRAQVKLQAEAHYDLLKEAMINKEEEMKRKFRRELEDKIDELKTEGRLNIAGMVGKLKGYSDAIAKRLLEKKQARDAQDLWCACQTLRSAVELPHGTRPPVQHLKPLMNDVINIIDISDGDEFVKTVTSAIPKVALDRGVYPKMTLKDRFLKVEQVASKLAQIDEPTAVSIPKLFVSWLQSFLIIKNIDPITSNEVANEPVDTSALSTYDILYRARYWIDRGDFLQAVRYMNLLTGAPREVAKDWIAEATILLETLQAADALLAHACAGSFSKLS